MHVLVTGGFGFIGRVAVAELVRAGHAVDVLTRDVGSRTVPDGARSVQCDLRDEARLMAIASEARYEAVCHLAGLVQARESVSKPLDYYEVNVGGTGNLLRAVEVARGGGDPPRFVLASTYEVYGPGRGGALSEDMPAAPGNPYAASKVACEHMVGHVAETGLISAITLRCFNVAGGADGHTDRDPTRLIPNVVRAARGDIPHFVMAGDGTVARDFVHVRDVASAFRLAVEYASIDTPIEVFNVGAGHATPIREVITAMESATGRPVPVKRKEGAPGPTAINADTGKIQHRLGWSADHSAISEIVASAFDSWESTAAASS